MKKQLRQDASKSLARERLRRRYRPARIKILFVGESPPASGRFFYKADSGLYRAMRETFVRALPDLKGDDFLASFCNRGYYLIDLCAKPVDDLDPKPRKEACIEAERKLSRMIRKLRPVAMVTLVRSIASNVRRAQQRAGWAGEYLELPYPGRWQRHRFEFDKQLRRFLRKHA